MRTFLLFVIYIFLCSNTYAQRIFENADKDNFPYSKWTSEELLKSNTAKEVDYLSDIEKDIIWYANLVRINPKLFTETVLEEYVVANDLHKSKYVKSLRRTLKYQKELSIFQPNKKLYDLALAHAKWSGNKGSIGHQKFNQRSDKSGFDFFKENCQYGYNNALDIFMDLLIDIDISDLGHRENFLSSDVQYIGVSMHVHKKYDFNCVIDFGG